MREDGDTSEIVLGMRRRGYATVRIPWTSDGPKDLFARFAELLERLSRPQALEAFDAVDQVLATMAAANPGYATSPLSEHQYQTEAAVFYGHTYARGTLEAVERHCALPVEVAALWRRFEATFEVVDAPLRRALQGLDGVDRMPSSLRVWKYVHNDQPWCSHPHYDIKVFSALIASENPGEELLRVGLEANGAPIEMVRERVDGLRQLVPCSDRLACIVPGVYANRWDLEPTWHYVRQLPGPGTCRYSLIWGLLHPQGDPVRMSPHIASLARTAREAARKRIR